MYAGGSNLYFILLKFQCLFNFFLFIIFSLKYFKNKFGYFPDFGLPLRASRSAAAPTVACLWHGMSCLLNIVLCALNFGAELIMLVCLS